MKRAVLGCFLLCFACTSENSGAPTPVADTATASDSASANDAKSGDDTALPADSSEPDTAVLEDTSVPADTTAPTDSGTDARDASDTSVATDTATSGDSGVVRTTIVAGYCPSSVTAPGLYKGTLGSNTNDITSVSGSCLLTAPGPDGALRVELNPGQKVRAVYRHAGDGVLYILDSCPVTSTCLAGSDTSSSGAETVEWTNTGTTRNPVYVVLDSDSLSGPHAFELDLYVTGP